MSDTNNATHFNRRLAGAALLVIVLIVLAMVFAPVWIIQPFRPQSQRGLELSFLLRRWSPHLTVVASVAALALALWLWRGTRRWWVKPALILAFGVTLVCAWFARQNHFEWMFNPLAESAYAPASSVDFADDADMVLAVEHNGEAVAYPVRLMAYHHLVQDVVGGTPIVATY